MQSVKEVLRATSPSVRINRRQGVWAAFATIILIALAAGAAHASVVRSEPSERFWLDTRGSGGLGGVVYDDLTGAALSGVAVTVTGGPSTATNAQGQYTITGLDSGAATVRAEMAGYYAAEKEITIAGSGTTICNFYLRPESGGDNPAVVDATSRWCSDAQHVYFLEGVALNVTFTAQVDWNGLTPDTVRFMAGGTPTDVPVTGDTATFTLDVGSDLNAGDQLKVKAIAGSGEESGWHTVNFDVVEPPLANLTTALLAPVPFGQSLKYTCTLSGGLTMMEEGAEAGAVPEDFPLLGGKAFKFVAAAKLQIEVSGAGTATAKATAAVPGKLPKVAGKELDLNVGFDAAWKYSPSQGKWVHDGGHLDIESGLSFSTPPYYWVFPAGPVPVPMYARSDVEVSLDATFGIVGWADDAPQLDGTLEFAPEVYGVLGVGVSGAFCVEGYLGGGPVLVVAYLPAPDLEELYLALAGGIRITALLWEYENDLLEYELDLLAEGAGPTQVFAGLDPSDFTLMDRSYLNRPFAGAMAGPGFTRPMGSSSVETVLRSNVFPYSEPELIHVGADRLLLAYVRDNTGRAAENRAEVVAMRYDGAWSADEPVWDDGTGDYSPSPAWAADTDSFIAWENAASVFPSGAELEDALPEMEIAVARGDTGTGAWSGAQALTNNDCLDRDPVLRTAADGSAMVVWIRNASNDLTGAPAEPNDIMYSLRAGSAGTWSAPATVASGLPGIVKLDLAYDGTTALIVWSEDGDGNLDTDDDRDIKLIQWNGTAWGSPDAITNDALPDDGVRVVTDVLSGERLILWARGDGIVMATESDPGNIITVVESPRTSGLTDFAVATGPAGQIALVWQDPSEEGTDLWCAMYDTGLDVWGEGVQLTFDRAMERSLSACYDEAGDLLVAYNKVAITLVERTVEVNGRPVTVTGVPQTGQTDLCILRHQIEGDLSVRGEEITLTPANPAPGSAAEIGAVVRNEGSVAAMGIAVAFYDGDPAGSGVLIGSDTIAGPVASGGAATATMSWTTPHATSARTLYVVVDPDMAQEDANRSNNTAHTTVLAPDLTVEEIYSEQAGPERVVITARLANRGALPVSPGDICLRLNGEAGDLLGDESVPALLPGSSHDVSWTWDVTGQEFPQGAAKVLAIADEADAVTEYDETNNRCLGLVEDLPALPVNLAVRSAPFDDVEVTGDPAETGGTTPYDCQVDYEAAFSLTAPGIASDGTYDYRLTGWEIGGEPGDPYEPQAAMTAGLDVTAMAEYTRLGDFDKDGDVDFWDFMIFVDVYDLASGDGGWLPNAPIGDFDDDGDVDFWDFMFFVDVYGT